MKFFRGMDILVWRFLLCPLFGRSVYFSGTNRDPQQTQQRWLSTANEQLSTGNEPI